MLREIAVNDRLNVRINRVAKARMVAECERRSRKLRRTYHLRELLQDFAFSLQALPEQVEREIEDVEDQDQLERPAGSKATLQARGVFATPLDKYKRNCAEASSYGNDSVPSRN